MLLYAEAFYYKPGLYWNGSNPKANYAISYSFFIKLYILKNVSYLHQYEGVRAFSA